MSELTHEEKFIIKNLKEKGGKLNYKDLQTLCQDEFEGVRLILKKLKVLSILTPEENVSESLQIQAVLEQ